MGGDSGLPKASSRSSEFVCSPLLLLPLLAKVSTYQLSVLGQVPAPPGLLRPVPSAQNEARSLAGPCEHLTKSCKPHTRDMLVFQGERLQVGSWPSGDTRAWLWAPRGLTPPSFLWVLSSFPRWWFGFSKLQPQTSFPSPSQSPDVVTIATVPTSAAPNNSLPGRGVRLMAPIPNQLCWSRTQAGRWPIFIG